MADLILFSARRIQESGNVHQDDGNPRCLLRRVYELERQQSELFLSFLF